MRRWAGLLIGIIICSALVFWGASSGVAKTQESAGAENVFFYAADTDGKAVLLKVIPFADLKAISHGRPDGGNYAISTTDNYPTTQYCEARGLTVPERP